MSDTRPGPKVPRPLSQARIEANRRNAQKSTGPRTPEGKARSRRNSLRDGLSARVVESESQTPLIEARAAEWAADLKPEGSVQRWVVRRAAAASVRLDLCEQAEAERRVAAADRAEAAYLRRERARIGTLAEGLPHDPTRIVGALESTAVGCEWLLEELAAMARCLSDPEGFLTTFVAERALMMLGLDPRDTRQGAGHPVAGPFMRAALANNHDHDPDDADYWTGLDTSALSDPAARRAAHAEHLPTTDAGRLHDLEAIVARMEELEQLYDARFEEVEGPAIDEARRRAALGIVGSKRSERLRRYEATHALEFQRALNLLRSLRRDAEPAAPAEPEPPSWAAPPPPPAPAPEPEPPAPRASADAPAQNEPKPAEPRGVTWGPDMVFDAPSDPLPPANSSPAPSPEPPPTPGDDR